MRNKLLRMIRQYDMMAPGDTVICAVSGGADSVALLFALYLLKDKLDIRLEAAHFNHHLRGEESDGDEAFVRKFCGRYDIPLHVGSAEVCPGKKGLEAAARDADLLCMDATYADDADLPKAELYGHATCRETGALAAAANVRRLWLTHYSAAVTDPAPGLAAARTAYPAAVAGYDGLTEELEFDREP